MAAGRLNELLAFLATLNEIKGNDKSMESQKKLLQGCLLDFNGGPRIEISEGANMLQQVRDANIATWMKDDVVEAVEKKIANSLASPNNADASQRATMQRNMFLYNYFSQGEWDTLRSPYQSLDTKLQVVAKRFSCLGMTCPSEPTYVLANAILHVAVHNGRPETLTFDPKKVITVLKDLKVMVKLKTKRATHSGLQVYPEHPSELVVDFLKAAYEEDPVKCPFDIKVINDLADEFPARKTKGSISGESRSIGGFKRDENFKDWFGNALMDRFMAWNGHVSGPAGLPLTMMGNTKKRKHELLALENGEIGEEKPGRGNDNTGETKELEKKEPKELEKKEPKEVDKKENLDVDIKNSSSKNAVKTVEEMASYIQDQLMDNKAAKAKTEKETPGKDGKSTEKKTAHPKQKAKAKAKAKAKSFANAKAESFAFKGTNKQSPMYIKNVTVYTCPASCNWRVKKNMDKKDKAFRWKSEDPKTVWKRVVDYVKEIST